MASLSDFEKLSFLKKGALFSLGEKAWLLWGAPQYLTQRPDAVALHCPRFFDEDLGPWVLYPYVMEIDRTEWGESLLGEKPELQWQGPDQALFKKQFDQAMEWFAEEKLEKIVPFVTEKSDCKISAPSLESLIKQAFKQEQGQVYGQWDLEEGWGVLGVTPETLLVQKSELEFETMALAGTTTLEEFEKDPEAFLNDPKEKEEHLKVVDALVDQLEPLGQLVMSEMETLSTPHLVHLHTSLFVKLKNRISLEKMIQKLHPTPALGCSPRSVWRKYLAEISGKEDRGCFGAPFTFSFSCKKAQTLVSIRNIRWSGGQVSLSSGCGLVKDSQFEKEWEELGRKRLSVKKMLGIQ